MTTHADMVANVLSMYAKATPAQVKRGITWYARMTAIVHGHARRLGITPESVAGVYAAFSINTPWKRNLALAAGMLRGRQVRTLGMCIAKAQACMAGASIGDVVTDASARKIRSFAANLAGDYSAVTVDRWALRIAYGMTDGGYVPKGSEYDAIAQAYRDAADVLGIAPAMVQAVTWCTLREMA